MEHEAGIVRWAFKSFLKRRDAARDSGGPEPARRAHRAREAVEHSRLVLRLLDSRHVAGIRVFRGEEIGPGNWPRDHFRRGDVPRGAGAPRLPVGGQPRGAVPAAEFLPAARAGVVRQVRHPDDGPADSPNHRPVYVCTNFRPASGAEKCYRRAGGATLERFVKDAAIDLLERLDVSGAVSASVLSDADNAAIDADSAELTELKAMWDAREITTSEYREMRKTVDDRIRKIEAKTVIRPAVEVLEGMTGTDARRTWEAHEAAGNVERLNAVLRFLFAAIRIAESTAPNGRFDYGRIEIEQNRL